MLPPYWPLKANAQRVGAARQEFGGAPKRVQKRQVNLGREDSDPEAATVDPSRQAGHYGQRR